MQKAADALPWEQAVMKAGDERKVQGASAEGAVPTCFQHTDPPRISTGLLRDKKAGSEEHTPRR